MKIDVAELIKDLVDVAVASVFGRIVLSFVIAATATLIIYLIWTRGSDDSNRSTS